MLNFEVRWRASEAQHIGATQDYRLALIALAALMGVKDASLPGEIALTPLEPATEEELSLPEFETLCNSAWEMRPDLEGSRNAVNVARATIEGLGILRETEGARGKRLAIARGEA